MNRRQFTKTLLASVTSFALLEALVGLDALASPVRPLVQHWTLRLQEYCGDLRKRALSPTEWQAQVQTLFQEIELAELLKFIDFQKLTRGFAYPDLGVNTKTIAFPKLEGLPEKLAYGKKIFGMKKGRAIIPHGHSNMASAHLILQGEMHLRHYEKLHQDAENLFIRPSIDKIARVGESSSISDDKDNVHWFIANTDAAFTLDIIVADLNEKSYDIHNLDMHQKHELPDGSLRVPILDVETALRRYGKAGHH
jgi:hypothetical protein